VARQEVVAAEAEMMVEAAGRMVGVEEVTPSVTLRAFRVRSCHRTSRRRETYRSMLAREVASPPYVHRTL
jgi:hypothetical protein